MIYIDIPPIHGRSSYRMDLADLGVEQNVDLTADTIYIEIPSAHVRYLLPPDAQNSKTKDILIPRIIVEALSTSPEDFAIIDETVPNYPVVILSGTICRNGYIGLPTIDPTLVALFAPAVASGPDFSQASNSSMVSVI